MIKDPRHPFFMTLRHNMVILMHYERVYISPFYGAYLCGEMGVASVYRPAFPEFEYCRRLLFSRIAVKIKKLFFPSKIDLFSVIFESNAC